MKEKGDLTPELVIQLDSTGEVNINIFCNKITCEICKKNIDLDENEDYIFLKNQGYP